MMKLFNLDDSENPGIVKVRVISTSNKMPVSEVEVVEIIRPSTFRKTKIGSKYTVSNRLLSEV